MQTKNRSFSEVINNNKPVLVDFSAEWCEPCKMMPPILKAVKEIFDDRMTVIKVDVDRNNELALHYGIRSVPTLIIFKNGNVLWRQSGVVLEKQLQPVIQQFL